MNNNTPTASQIELLMSDWLHNLREQGSFVHKNRQGTITRSRTANHSDYFMGDMSQMTELDILRNSREIAQGMVDSMTDRSVKVILGNGDSATNGEKIVVATDYFDDKKLSIGDKIDILTGFSIHEASHINYTDDQAHEAFINSMPVQLRALMHSIWNILEDERIEYLTGEERPGLSDFIAVVKDYCWSKYGEGKASINEGITEVIPRFVNVLLAAVRFPSMLQEADIVEHYEQLRQIRNVLTPYPLSTEGVFDATRRILDIIKNIIKEQLQQEQEKKDQQPQQESQQNDQSGQDGQPGQGSPGGAQGNPGQNSQGSQNATNRRKPSAKEVSSALEKALGTEQMQKVLQKVKEATESNSSSAQDKQANCLKNAPNGDTMYVNGEAEKNPGGGAGHSEIRYAIQVKGNENAYKAALRKVKPYIPAIKKALTCKTQARDYELRGERSGKLNTHKLASLRSGNRNLFTKQGEVTCSRASVCVLIDESGSMNCQRKKAALEAAVLIREAVKDIDNLDLYIYGFGGDTMKVYAENRKTSRWALGSIDNSGGTPTGAAMEIAYKKMSKHPNPAALMLVITDGEPSIRDTVIAADEKLRKKGVIPVGIGIAGCSAVTRIFKESIVYDDLNVLASELGKITKKRLLKLLERNDSAA